MIIQSKRKFSICLNAWMLMAFLYPTIAFSNSIEESSPVVRATIEAAYIPLADHYAAIIAYELYRGEMVHADFSITQMKSWDLLRAYFLEGLSGLVVKEVAQAIERAGRIIENARNEGGGKLEHLITLIRKYTPDAIRASLNPELRVINYNDLLIDKSGLRAIMDITLEGGILKHSVDIDNFAASRFVPAIDGVLE